jgi:hypothetical protein
MPDWRKLDNGRQHAWYRMYMTPLSSHCGIRAMPHRLSNDAKAKKCRKCRHVERFQDQP